MGFNSDPSIQAHEVIFSRKLQKSIYPPLHFNNIAVTQSTTQKHLVMLLDVKLDFRGYLKNIYSKVKKTIGQLPNLYITLSRLPLLSIYKSFIRPYRDYRDIWSSTYCFISPKDRICSIQISISYYRRYKRDIYGEPLSWARFRNPWKMKMILDIVLLL